MASPTRRSAILALSAALVMCFAATAAAQTSATIFGTVKDQTNAVLPGATVTVTNVDTGMSRTATTDGGGRYRFPELSPGSYQVQVELSGFRTVVRRGMTLSVGSGATVDFSLPLGQVGETVEVTAEVPLVETSHSTVSDLVDERSLHELPINARSFVELTKLQDGVNPVRAATASAGRGAGQLMAISGAHPSNNTFMIDGVSINNYRGEGPAGVGGVVLGAEAVREFRILTHNYSAEYGRASGAVISVVSKSGTNTLSGSGYYFHRDDKLDARNFFDIEKPPFTRKQYGASLGGPIVRDRTHFFANYEGLRESLGLTLRSNVPTAAAREGILPTGRVTVNPGVKPLLALYPLPNGTDFGDGRAEYVFTFNIPQDKDYFTTRVDHKLNGSNWMFARYTIDNGKTMEPRNFPDLFDSVTETPTRYLSVEVNSALSPRVVNTLRIGAVNNLNNTFNVAHVTPDPSLFLTPGYHTMAWASTTGLAGIEPQFNHYRDYRTYEFADNVTITRQAHSMKLGFMAQHILSDPNFDTRMEGRFNFASLSDLLQGRANRVQFVPLALSSPARRYRQNLFGFFFQDDYQVRSNLTLNLGVRHEFSTILKEIDGVCPYLIDETVMTSKRSDVVVAENCWLTNPTLKQLAPRVGFAYDPAGNGKTSIRGAFGVFFDHTQFTHLSQEFARMNPHNVFDVRGTIAYPTTDKVVIALVGNPPLGNAALYFGNHPKAMYNINTSFDIQRQIGADMSVSVGYRGRTQKNQIGTVDLNMAVSVGTGADGRPVYSRTPVRPNPNWESILVRAWGYEAFYNAGSVRLQKRLSHGLQFQTSYTYSKAIDDGAAPRGGSALGPADSGIGNAFSAMDKHADRAISGYDLTHNFNASFTYELPFAKDSQGVAQHVLGGWSLAGLLALSSGPPLDVHQATSTATAILAGSRRPDIVPGRTKDDIILGGADQYYDPTAYTFAAATLLGTVGRNTLRAPGYFNVDFALSKNWRAPSLTKDFEVQFRAEAFNLLNHTNLGLPSMTVFNANGARLADAGRITSTIAPARTFQIGMRVVF